MSSVLIDSSQRRSMPCLGFGVRLVGWIGLAWTILANSQEPDATLSLDFVHEINETHLRLDSIRYRNTSHESFSITRLAWLASGFSITTKDNQQIEFPKSVAYIPSEGSSLQLTHLPAKEITALSFYIGPSEDDNHSSPANHAANSPLNPNINALHWDWQGGYIFVAMEGHWRTQPNRYPEGFAYHFARDNNRTQITIPLNLTLEPNGQATVAIALDPSKIISGLSFKRDGNTTHSAVGDAVSEKIKSNLVSAFRIARVTPGSLAKKKKTPKPIDLPSNPQPYPIRIPKHIPLPSLPTDNPILAQRVALGESLFHSTLLSRNRTLSCSSCHQGPTLSDPRRFSLGVDGQQGPRHSMPLFNLAWKSSFFWDGRAPSLRVQALQPIQDHLEMDESLENIVSKLKQDKTFPRLFAAAFGSGAITPQNVGLAIENFLLTRLSFDSKLDQSLKGKAVLTTEEKRGFELFFTEFEPRMGKRGADCFHCHGGAHFTDHAFHNNGLPTTDDIGLAKVTGRDRDRYKFSTPSLRNIAKTAPYMHDGSLATLEEVVEHYNEKPMLSETLDPNLAKHKTGLGLSEADKAALVAFLRIL